MSYKEMCKYIAKKIENRSESSDALYGMVKCLALMSNKSYLSVAIDVNNYIK